MRKEKKNETSKKKKRISLLLEKEESRKLYKKEKSHKKMKENTWEKKKSNKNKCPKTKSIFSYPEKGSDLVVSRSLQLTPQDKSDIGNQTLVKINFAFSSSRTELSAKKTKS